MSAGRVRSDPKVLGEETFEFGNGPQGDAVRFSNYVLCISDGVAEPFSGDDPSTLELSNVDIVPLENSDVPTIDGANAQGKPGEPGPDLATAAATLGTTEQVLRDALGPPPPNFEAAAEALGITVEALQNALGDGENGPPAPGQ